MLIGRIRPVEIRTIELSGESLEDVHAQADVVTLAGWELVSCPVKMSAGTSALTALATIARRDEPREIEAETLERMREFTPDGWELISVR